ncbi:VOC family protein [Skermania sp. ID1734]|uniref:VOC family protein n=1 Tax=Skermania sp. ID1734 TaxID=2597516 RepID=UPI00118012C9|nr:VOC family protein [Skermania sp. ID1734]TSD96592.1 VOC family protein [Skermania sp. ID1734]
MIDHFGINCADLEAAKKFYDTVLGTLGFSRQLDFGVAVGYGANGKPDFWLSSFEGIGPNREVHVAFQAADAARVRDFYEAAIAAGAESLHEPRMWPEYHDHYYGGFVRDLDGNNIEAVCHNANDGD